MSFKDFFIKTTKDIFIASFVVLVIFSLLEWFEPGFVSFYIGFSVLLIIPLIFGILTILLYKK